MEKPGRVWPRGQFWIAYLAAANEAHGRRLFEAGLEFERRDRDASAGARPAFSVVKPSCTILAIKATGPDEDALRLLRAWVEQVVAGSGLGDAGTLHLGISRGYAEQRPTPLLRADAIGPAVTAAHRGWKTAVAHRRRIGIAAALQQRLVELGFGATAAVDGVTSSHRIALVESDDASQLWGFARATAAAARPGDIAESAPATGQAPKAFAVVADMIGSSRFSAEAYGCCVSALMRSVRNHVPAVLGLDGMKHAQRVGGAPLTLWHDVFFEYTGDGFYLVCYPPADGNGLSPDECLSWLATLMTEVEVRGRFITERLAEKLGQGELRTAEPPTDVEHVAAPVTVESDGPMPAAGPWAAHVGDDPILRLRFAAAFGDQAYADYDGWRLPVGGPFAMARRLCEDYRVTGRPELTTLALEHVAVHVPGVEPIPLAACRDDIEPPPPASGAVGLDRLTQQGRRFATAKLGGSPPTLAHRALDDGEQRATRTMQGRATFEAALTALAAAGLSTIGAEVGWMVWLGTITLGGLLFGWLGAGFFRRYLTLRFLPTLQRHHFDGSCREPLRRSALRLAAALRSGDREERRRGVHRECGRLGPLFWLSYVRRGIALKHLDRLPLPSKFWPSIVIALVGAASYAGVAVATVMLGWLHYPGDWGWVVVAGTAIVGIGWNACMFWRVRKIPHYLMFLSHGETPDVADHHLKGRRLDFVNGVLHLLIVALLGVGLGLHATDPWHQVIAAVGLVVAISSGYHSMRHLLDVRTMSRRWARSFDASRLRADGSDLVPWRGPEGQRNRKPHEYESIPLDPINSAMHLMVNRGDLLHAGMRAIHRHVAADSLAHADLHGAAWFVTTHHGVLLYWSGSCLNRLGWSDDRPPVRVSAFYGDGDFAAKAIDSWARNAQTDTLIDVRLLGAGPPSDGNVDVQPFRLLVRALNVDQLAAGYVGLAMPRGNVWTCPAYRRRRPSGTGNLPANG